MDRFTNHFSALTTIFKRRSLRNAIPFFVLVFGGSLYLEQFSQIRYKFGRSQSALSPEELKHQGIEVKKREEVTLEAQYEKIRDLDTDNWEQIRGPRPWESSTSSN